MYTTMYPTALPSRTNLPVQVDDVDDVEAAVVNDPVSELLAGLNELGTLPSGSAASVTARLAVSLNDDGSLKSTLSPQFASLGIGTAPAAGTSIKVTQTIAAGTAYALQFVLTHTASGAINGAVFGSYTTINSTSTAAKSNGSLTGDVRLVNDDSLAACSNYELIGYRTVVDSDHTSVPCTGGKFEARGLGINRALYVNAHSGSTNHSFYGVAGLFYNTDGVRIGTDDTDHMIDEASNGAATADLYIGNKLIVVENSTPNLGATTVGDGGTTNYLAIAADGELVLHGTARVTRHIHISPAILKLPAANYPSAGLIGLFPTLDYDAGASDESAYTEIEVPFRWDSATDIEVEISWTYEGGQDNGTVVWGIEYKGVKAGEAVTGAGTSVTQKSAGTHATGDEVRTTFSTKILAANLQADDDLGIRAYRHSSDSVNDTLAVDAKLINVHLHMIMNKLGQPT